jgi:hypothetical protein
MESDGRDIDLVLPIVTYALQADTDDDARVALYRQVMAIEDIDLAQNALIALAEVAVALVHALTRDALVAEPAQVWARFALDFAAR